MSILLTDLTKRFRDTPVVHDVSLEVADGELFVLLGSSGSGKSTILRLIAGLIEPDSGRIELNGREVTFLPAQAREVGFVFQNYSIFRHMTVAENIEFGLRIRRVPTAKRRMRREELLDLLGLTGLGERYADELSGGQQQRVALARALAYQPTVLLLDEPFGALDVKIRSQLRQRFKEIQRRFGVTTMLVTHDQQEAFELADRIGVIERGHLFEVGRPEELYHHPRSEFVATFIGGANVLVGRVREGQIRLGSTTLPFPPDAPAHDEGAPVRILFRPETVLLQPEPFAAHSGVHVLGRGEVVDQLFAGSWRRVRLAVEGLQGVRPLVPPLAYGQRTAHIEAVQPSGTGQISFTPGQRPWVGLRDYHLLQPTGLKILICTDELLGGEAAIDFGGRLAQAAGGPVMLLAVADSAEALAETRKRLEALRQQRLAYLPRLETRIRQGAIAREILLEAQEGHYELVILGQYTSGTTSVSGSLLEETEVPVLLVQSPRSKVERILICTAAGEPGKTAVQFGGRLARQTAAPVTVLHVRHSQATPEAQGRLEQHLGQAQAMLKALGVKNEVKIEEEPALTCILGEAERGDYDLLVIGAPAHQQFRRHDLATQIIHGTTRPVVVVPMIEY